MQITIDTRGFLCPGASAAQMGGGGVGWKIYFQIFTEHGECAGTHLRGVGEESRSRLLFCQRQSRF